MRREIGGRFQPLAQASRGSMGSVYRARDLATGHVVALKVLTLDRPFDLVRFGREATLLAKVHHPNVVDYVAHGESEGVHYLVQEWVEGVTLAEKLLTTGVTVSEAVAVAIGLAGALEATHARGIIHRDIKPANIILADDRFDRVKLVDFGIARLTSEAGVLTRTGKLVGTPSYMAPEQTRGSINLEAAADIWSFGCVLYETLGGRVAFDGRSPAAVRAKVLADRTSEARAAVPRSAVRPARAGERDAREGSDEAAGERPGPRRAAARDARDRGRGRAAASVAPRTATLAMPIRPARHTEVDAPSHRLLRARRAGRRARHGTRRQRREGRRATPHERARVRRRLDAAGRPADRQGRRGRGGARGARAARGGSGRGGERVRPVDRRTRSPRRSIAARCCWSAA